MTFVLLTLDMSPIWGGLTNPKIIEAHVSNKTVPETTPNIPQTAEEGSKDQNLRYNLSKFEYDLYHEEDDVAEKVIRVKRISLPNKGEKWKVFSDNKLIFVIEGNKLTKREKEFLQGANGVNFILACAKSGFISFNKFRAELKRKIDDESPCEVVKNAVQKQRRRHKKQEELLPEK